MGLGKKLTEAILAKGKERGIHMVLARIADGNAASIHLCEQFGFRYIGNMREAGRKFDRMIDVHLYQLLLGSERWSSHES